MVEWPAVIKFDGDDELAYIGSAEEWLRDADSHLYNHRGNNQLIDSNGDVYRLEQANDQMVISDAADSSITLDAFIRLVRMHASTTHRCCIEKINFRTVFEGIDLIASMNETD